MAVIYIFPHFDDEYCAFPIWREHQRAGDEQYFFYVADYAPPGESARRYGETRRLLAKWGLDPGRAEHLGPAVGAQDGSVHLALARIYPALHRRIRELGRIDKIVCPAWEGGHMDHDASAALAMRLARDFDVGCVEQIALYNGEGLIGPLFHAARPLPQNGPVRKLRLTWREFTRWAADVRCYPSQATTWLGLWPTTFSSLLLRGFGVQTLSQVRVRERPHAGRLLYERMYGTTYADVRAAVDALLEMTCRPGSHE